MNRFLIALACAIVASATALAQDMPLSQILIDGEGWRKVEGKSEKPKGVTIKSGFLMTEGLNSYHITFPSGKTFQVDGLPGVGASVQGGLPTAALLTPDGGTLYVGGGKLQHLWACHLDKGGWVTIRDRYAPLRVKRGEKSIAVTSLAADKDGRIYAATEIGVQVFDPTGRLCGVLTPAAPGKPEHLAFEGDTLTLWIDETKYARKLNTQGAK